MAESSLDMDAVVDELVDADDGSGLIFDTETQTFALRIEIGDTVHVYEWDPVSERFRQKPDPDDDNDDEKKVSKSMAVQRVRKRMVIDLLVDPGTASPRVMDALANDAQEFLQVLRVKDREVTLAELGDFVSVHDHVSRPGEACAHCVQLLAMDERA